jgi:hypothetical protein
VPGVVQVAAGRFGKERLHTGAQIAIIAQSFALLRVYVADAKGCILLRINQSGIIVRTLEELIEEIDGPSLPCAFRLGPSLEPVRLMG